MKPRPELPDQHWLDFTETILYECPRCSHCAVWQKTTHTLVCPKCACVRPSSTNTLPPFSESDVRLFLSTPCCSETLWAFNAEHLRFLRDYVESKLRPRARDDAGWRNQGLRSRLPRWLKLAKNRDNVLAAIAKLEEKLLEDSDSQK